MKSQSKTFKYSNRPSFGASTRGKMEVYKLMLLGKDMSEYFFHRLRLFQLIHLPPMLPFTVNPKALPSVQLLAIGGINPERH